MRMPILIAACVALAACASSPDPGPTPEEIAAQNAVAATAAMATIPDSALGPQDLAPGECGLFLWSKTDLTKFIFFSKAITGTALISRTEGPVLLTQTGARGDIFGQFNTQMDYLDPNGVQFALKMEPGEELEGGQRVASALITTTNAEGWQTKLPVLGVRACQPEI